MPTIGLRLGIRLRSALAAALVVAAASVLAGAVLLVTARGILLDNVNAAAADRAAQVASALGGTDAGPLTAAVRPSAPERSVVQVLDPAGRVSAATDVVAGAPPMSPLRPGPGRTLQETRHLSIGHDSPFRIVATGVTTDSGVQTVLVAESLDLVDDSTEAILAALAVGLPLLAVMVGGATFLFVGRTLRPVDAMRRRADSITAKNLHSRLPVPSADDEVAALAVTMNTMLDRIEAASAAQRRFVADASHELRSPLATIHANSELLRMAALPQATARSARRIAQESERMARLVEDLLLLARIDEHTLPPRRVDVDLDDLVYAERERISVEYPHLRLGGAVEPVRVQGDPDQLHRAVRNLVDNAVQHARSRVTVGSVRDAGRGQIVVGNDGLAIATEDRAKIFERFVRLDDSRSRQGGGSGLGLSIARDIVIAHGGALEVDDTTNGVVMRITLPSERSDPPKTYRL
ncbi:sensor histidine kinase [Micromonospora sp. 067-2]|uniref:sensor histidine kinase n=1 Tax=Micromonospora sp. 067-2 TaxID=2789270 RepID=UPI00397CFFCF